MLSTPDVEGLDDFIKYYRYQWAAIGAVSGLLPARILGMDGNGHINMEVIKDAEGGIENMVWTWEKYKAEGRFGIPKLGMRNAGPTVAFLFRSPERQWSRGYRPDGTSINVPNEWILRKAKKKAPTTSDAKLIWQVYRPEFTSFQKAVNQLTNGERIGVAVDEQNAVVTLDQCPHPVLVHRRSIVGHWDEEKLVVNKLFEDLVPRFMRDFKVPVKIAA